MSAKTRRATISATSTSTHLVPAGSRRAFDGGEGVDVIPIRPHAPSPSTGRASRSTPPATTRWLLSATLVSAMLAPLLLLLGALIRRRPIAPEAPPYEEAIVLTLPLARRPEPLREHQRLAA
jgi:hypothetical protein